MTTYVLTTEKTIETEIAEIQKYFVCPVLIKLHICTKQTPQLTKITNEDILVIYSLSHFKTTHGMCDLMFFVARKKLRLIQFKDKKEIPGSMSAIEFILMLESEEHILRNLWRRERVKKERMPRAQYLDWPGLQLVEKFMEEKLTQQEMATKLGCSLGTIKLATGRLKKEASEKKARNEYLIKRSKELDRAMRLKREKDNNDKYRQLHARNLAGQRGRS